MKADAPDDGKGKRDDVKRGLEARPELAQDVCEAIPAEQCGLEKQHAAVPHRRAAAEQGQDELGRDGLDQEEKRCADEDGDGEKREHGLREYQGGAARVGLRAAPAGRLGKEA